MNKDFIKFIEDYHGIKLTTYQKVYLKAFISKDKLLMYNSRLPYKKLIHNLIIEYNKTMKNDFYVATPEGIEEYRNGELVSIKKNKSKSNHKVILEEFR